MSGSIKDLRRRIRSVKSTQQITRAMKLVAASKLRKAQEAMEEARPYARGIRELLENLVTRVGSDGHELMEAREGKKTLLVVVTSDRGLCGGFNGNVLKEAMRYLESSQDREFTVECVGKKAGDFFDRRSYPIRARHDSVFGNLNASVSAELTETLIAAFVDEGFDEVQVLSNHFRTVMAQDLLLETLLPAGAPSDEGEGKAEAAGDYIYEPSPEALLNSIVPRSVETLVHQALLDSYAAEMGARMVAMETATKNAGEMIDSLTLVMNRKRQAAITTEIIEVVSGAMALEA